MSNSVRDTDGRAFAVAVGKLANDHAAKVSSIDESTGSVTRVFTLGYGHTDPMSGKSLAECCAVITAATYERCREAMFERWGNRWAFDYESVEKAAGRSGRLRVVQIINEVGPVEDWTYHADCDGFFAGPEETHICGRAK